MSDLSADTTSQSTPAGNLPARRAEVHRRLGVTGPAQHAAGAIAQGEDVPGAVEVVRTRRGVDERANRRRAVVGRDARRRAVSVVHRHREGRSLGLGVGDDHEGQVEFVGALALEGCAEDPRGVLEEERHGLGRDVLGRHDEVALVLAVLVVDHDDHAAAAQSGRSPLRSLPAPLDLHVHANIVADPTDVGQSDLVVRPPS